MQQDAVRRQVESVVHSGNITVVDHDSEKHWYLIIKKDKKIVYGEEEMSGEDEEEMPGEDEEDQ